MIRIESFTEAGGDHAANEDAFVARTHPYDESLVVCVVADGQGGRAGGAKAARFAATATANLAAVCPLDRLADPKTWLDIVRHVDGATASDPEAGFTTLVGLCATPDRIVGASAGDSDALLVTAADATILTGRQKKNPPVGSGGAEPVAFAATPDGPWKLLALTDGVWKYVGWERVIAAARETSGRDLLAGLERAARLPGSGRFQDDFTAVLLELDRTTQAGGR